MLVTVVILLMFPWTGRLLTARVTVVSLTTLCASLICLSRIFLGVHYLTDVLGGVLLGSALCLVAHRLVGPVAPVGVHMAAATGLRSRGERNPW
jgi:undecaprenyl-diphosphatase